jgi:hypothetical protein
VRAGKWKLVSPDFSVPYKPWRPHGMSMEARPSEDSDALWELYDMEADCTEEHNLAAQYLEPEMIQMYHTWEHHCAQS